MQLYTDSTDTTQFMYNFPYFHQVQCFIYQVHVHISKRPQIWGPCPMLDLTFWNLRLQQDNFLKTYFSQNLKQEMPSAGAKPCISGCIH